MSVKTYSERGGLGKAPHTVHRELVAYYETAVTTNDKQPVYRCPVARTLQALHYYKDNTTALSGTTTIVLQKNGSPAYTWTFSSLANQTMTLITSAPVEFAANDVISWAVTAAGATAPSNLTITADFTETV